MKTIYQTLTLALAALLLCSVAEAAIMVEVVPSSAPNYFGSPSWAGYLANANNSLENSTGVSIGDRNTDPTAYEALADGQNIPAGDILVSGFSSWRGVAGAAAPFDNEFGNRVHFGVHITGDGIQKFRGSDISGEITSSDGNTLGIASTPITSGTYTSTRIGINWGADMAKGGGDDTIYNAGQDHTFPIDEFIYVGFGNAYDASFETGPSDQEKLDQAIAGISPNFPINVTGAYTVTNVAGNMTLGTGSASINIVPEPTTVALAGLAGLMGILLPRRRCG